MGTISAGTGLISGLDIQSLVTQLMEIERKPVTLLNDRIDELTQELSQFKESEPGTEGGQKGPDAEMPANPRSQVFGALRKYAH